MTAAPIDAVRAALHAFASGRGIEGQGTHSRGARVRA